MNKKKLAKINKKLNNPYYQSGVKDSLQLMLHYINGLDHSAGFRSSQLAQDHSNMLKNLYNQIHSNLVR